MVLRFLAVTIIFILAGNAHAFEASKLNGVGTYTKFNQELFFVGLYTDKMTLSPNEFLSDGPRSIHIRVIADKIRLRSFKRLWLESISINSSSEHVSKHVSSIVAFSDMLSFDLLKNDLLTVSKNTSNSIKIAINGLELGTVVDPGFFSLLALAWLGDTPPSSHFKRDLLAAGNISTEQLSRFINERRAKEQRMAYLSEKLREKN